MQSSPQHGEPLPRLRSSRARVVLLFPDNLNDDLPESKESTALCVCEGNYDSS